ncbi:hypothetical protein [Streptomonospora sp. PA3]|uniref:hypothetical protein n=1 Tax=Streptomonospora sp. PA3 TaxID=2607326 RepID=UPI0012DD0944|nr:hypothetical protein [Streptomonospora sp. PA3]
MGWIKGVALGCAALVLVAVVAAGVWFVMLVDALEEPVEGWQEAPPAEPSGAAP